MPEYDNTDRGVLWLNDKKSDKAPDYTGTYNHEGEEIKIAGWVRTTKTGKTLISISKDTYEPKESGKDSQAWQQARDKFKKDDSNGGLRDEIQDEPINLDDIPF